MTKKALYILFVLSGLVPATLLLFITLILFWDIVSLAGFNNILEGFFLFFFVLCGVCGYMGFFSLLRGFHKEYYKTNLILLGLSLIYFGYSSLILTSFFPNITFNVTGFYVLLASFVCMLPNIVSITFIILISKKMIKQKNNERETMKDKFYNYIQQLQDTITSKLEEIDGVAKFREDLWERPEGGGGRTRVIENGAVFEKGGVNISAVEGHLPEAMQKAFNVGDVDFFACGLSLVLHPKNPMVPTVHANWRYFEMYDKQGNKVGSWFGGGQDLTPYYLFEEDAVHFHQVCKTACDKHNTEFYPRYKKQCDDYFWNSHRNEARGIGGLFFDHLVETKDHTMENWYDFVTEVGNSFLDSYVPIVKVRKDFPYIDANRTWQEIRRGRYVEFNLVHDKGTLFGLKTNGRIESILMSLPPHVQWIYDHHPEPGSEEEKLIKVLAEPKEWL